MNHWPPAAQELMACLGEESRFRLVQALIGGARCVSDLAAEVGLSQSCTTRHLQSLERRRVVSGTRDGKRVLYRIREDDPGLMPLLGWALSEPKAAAGIRARRLARKDPESPGERQPDGPPSEPRPARRASRPEPTHRAPAETAQRPARPETQAENTPPAPERQPPPPPPRRSGASDIEDFLL